MEKKSDHTPPSHLLPQHFNVNIPIAYGHLWHPKTTIFTIHPVKTLKSKIDISSAHL